MYIYMLNTSPHVIRLRKIGRSSTEEEYTSEVEILKDMDLYKSNTAFRNWIVKQWLAEHIVRYENSNFYVIFGSTLMIVLQIGRSMHHTCLYLF